MENTKNPKPYCCYLEGGKADGKPCGKDAEYEIFEHANKHPSECYTHSCLEHIGELLTDAKTHTVVHLDPPEPFEAEVFKCDWLPSLQFCQGDEQPQKGLHVINCLPSIREERGCHKITLIEKSND